MVFTMLSMICQAQSISTPTMVAPQALTLAEANKLVSLPLHCVETSYPCKTGVVLASAADVKEPVAMHPVFYGCFDWHSAVHGYWSMNPNLIGDSYEGGHWLGSFAIYALNSKQQ